MKHRRRGSALIEFAGSLILLTTLFTGIFQIAYAFFSYNALVNAVRAGARYASLQPPSPELAKSVQNLTVYGEPTPPTVANSVVPGLSADNIQVTFGPSTATVTVRGFQLNSLLGQFKLDGRPTVTFPITGGAGK